jgi:hypothetical protein
LKELHASAVLINTHVLPKMKQAPIVQQNAFG